MASKQGSIVHVELQCADPTKSKAFYREVFGWKFEEQPQMDYTTWRAPSAPAGGLMGTMEGRPPQVLNYLLADDIDRTIERIAVAGGTILQQKMEIPGVGWWALFLEPGGTTMAVFQNKPVPRPARRPAARRSAARKAKTGRKKRK